MLSIVYEFNQEYGCNNVFIDRNPFFIYLDTLLQDVSMGNVFFICLN